MPDVDRRQALTRLAGGVLAVPWTWPTRAQGSPTPLKGQTVRMAFIDPLSGPAGDIGRNSLRSWQFMAEHLGGDAHPTGLRFQVAGFDNKGSPQESLNALKAAIDHGFRYIVQGNGSGVAAALSEAIGRHNARFPQRSVLFLNYAAMDPALTNELCSPWHFRLDADTSMKMRALTRFIAQQPLLRRVYLINQNYAHGQQFSRWFRTEMALQSPDVQVVGDELHPPFALDDFSPQIRRLQAAGAHALVTGNWGADMRGLVRALVKQGVNIPLLAYYPALKGTPEVLAEGGPRLSVYQVATSHSNQGGEAGQLAQAFRQRHGEDFVVYAAYDGLQLLLQAMHLAGSTSAALVAHRMSGLGVRGFNGPVTLRAQDHQLQTGLYISRWQPVDARHPVAAEGTGYTFAPVAFQPGPQVSTGSSCSMPGP